jgi:D-threo-aldose 1-dehydrogenase
MDLETRTLGRTGLHVPVLGLGTRGIAELDRDLGVDIVRRALDSGVTYIDTAPLYGDGASERCVGLALRDHPARTRCIVATKVGWAPAGFDWSYAATVESVHGSLERLGLDRVALVQLHELSLDIWDAAMHPGGAMDALRDLKAEGLVEHIGVTSRVVGALQRLLHERPADVETLLIWRDFNLLLRAFADEVIPRAGEVSLGVIVGTPFATGILASGSRAGAQYLYQDAASDELHRVQHMEALCRQAGVPLGAAALRYVLRPPAVAIAVTGADDAEQIAMNARWAATPVPEWLLTSLDAL